VVLRAQQNHQRRARAGTKLRQTPQILMHHVAARPLDEKVLAPWSTDEAHVVKAAFSPPKTHV
jgi:hypothetical protein